MKYLPKFNKNALSRLHDTFMEVGVKIIEDAIKNNWNKELATTEVNFIINIPANALYPLCQCPQQDQLLKNLSYITFTFNTAQDLECTKEKQVPIGEWIKASKIKEYDIWSLGNIDVLLRSKSAFDQKYCDDSIVTRSFMIYELGYLYEPGKCVYIPHDDQDISLNEEQWDIMIIKAN